MTSLCPSSERTTERKRRAENEYYLSFNSKNIQPISTFSSSDGNHSRFEMKLNPPIPVENDAIPYIALKGASAKVNLNSLHKDNTKDKPFLIIGKYVDRKEVLDTHTIYFQRIGKPNPLSLGGFTVTTTLTNAYFRRYNSLATLQAALMDPTLIAGVAVETDLLNSDHAMYISENVVYRKLYYAFFHASLDEMKDYSFGLSDSSNAYSSVLYESSNNIAFQIYPYQSAAGKYVRGNEPVYIANDDGSNPVPAGNQEPILSNFFYDPLQSRWIIYRVIRQADYTAWEGTDPLPPFPELTDANSDYVAVPIFQSLTSNAQKSIFSEFKNQALETYDQAYNLCFHDIPDNRNGVLTTDPNVKGVYRGESLFKSTNGDRRRFGKYARLVRDVFMDYEEKTGLSRLNFQLVTHIGYSETLQTWNEETRPLVGKAFNYVSLSREDANEYDTAENFLKLNVASNDAPPRSLFGLINDDDIYSRTYIPFPPSTVSITHFENDNEIVLASYTAQDLENYETYHKSRTLPLNYKDDVKVFFPPFEQQLYGFLSNPYPEVLCRDELKIIPHFGFLSKFHPNQDKNGTEGGAILGTGTPNFIFENTHDFLADQVDGDSGRSKFNYNHAAIFTGAFSCTSSDQPLETRFYSQLRLKYMGNRMNAYSSIKITNSLDKREEFSVVDIPNSAHVQRVRTDLQDYVSLNFDTEKYIHSLPLEVVHADAIGIGSDIFKNVGIDYELYFSVFT